MEMYLLALVLLLSFSAIFFLFRRNARMQAGQATLELERGVALSRVSALETEQSRLQAELAEARQWILSLEKTKATFENQNTNLERRLQEQAAEIQNLHQRLQLEFENIANRIFEQKTSVFKEESQRSMGNLLNPLKERIQEFQKKVEDTYHSESRERLSLQNEIKQMHAANDRMSLETTNLTRALKGDVKMQGNWGELVLERILESSGLRKGEEYILQGADLKLVHEDGRRQQPDAIILLPEDKHLIIDSKVSLVHYDRLAASSSEEERKQQVKLFMDSIRAHILNLASKEYASNKQINAPNFVLMFIPIEGAFALALTEDRELFSYAWDRSVCIVSPVTLTATLKTVASIWRHERQTQNAQEMALQCGALYDKFAGLLTDLEDVGKSIKRSEESYQQAWSKLKSGKGNLIGRVEKIREMGAKTKKQIQTEYEKDEDAAVETLEILDAAEGEV